MTRPLERIAIDLTDLTAGSDGYRYCLSVIDHFSRYVKFYPLKGKTATVIVKHLEEYVNDFGRPDAILLDNALEFSGSDMRDFANRQKIKLCFVTPYRPQANGLVERMHRTMKMTLAQLCAGYPLRWPKLIPECQRLMNEAVHCAIGMTPFEAFYNRPVYRGGEDDFPLIRTEDDKDRQMLREIIKEKSMKSQRRYRALVNRKKKKEKVGKGALVWIKSEQQMLGTARKLNRRWKGPYKVIEVLQDGVAYVVENPFTKVQLRRAAEKVRPYMARYELISGMEEELDQSDDEEDQEILPPRQRRPPWRLIEEDE